MPKRPCLGWDGVQCGVLTPASRCPTHAAQAAAAKTRAARAARPVGAGERARRAEAVDEWVRTHGWWCPGWGVPDHYSDDLTADHVVAVAAGGPEDGALGVLCRPCNGRKGARTTQGSPTGGYRVRSE